MESAGLQQFGELARAYGDLQVIGSGSSWQLRCKNGAIALARARGGVREFASVGTAVSTALSLRACSPIEVIDCQQGEFAF